jgi:hypothetical protein
LFEERRERAPQNALSLSPLLLDKISVSELRLSRASVATLIHDDGASRHPVNCTKTLRDHDMREQNRLLSLLAPLEPRRR